MDFPQSASDWRQVIEDKANKLQAYLATFPDWGNCPVCEKAYPDSLGPHIAGKDHWKKLRWKVEVAPKQEWRNPKGDVITFDHLSGEIGFVDLASQPVPKSTQFLSPYSGADASSSPTAPFLEKEADVLLEPKNVFLEPESDTAFLEREPDNVQTEDTHRPSPEQLQELWAAGQLYCDSCLRIRPVNEFHKQQQKYSRTSRKCIECTARDSYEQSKLTCRICGQSMSRDSFRKKVNWDAPECASCLSDKEKRAYAQWQSEREEEAAKQAEIREEMAEGQLRENFQIGILARMSSMTLKQSFSPLFQEERKIWAAKLMHIVLNLKELDEQWSMELSHVLCELSLLSQIQGKETPSRDHASDREEAEKFKDLEDLGDNLFKDFALSFFRDFVMKEDVQTMTSTALAQKVKCKGRSMYFGGRVVACLKSCDKAGEAKLGRSSLLDARYYHEEGWKQISANELYVLRSLDMELQVKTYPQELWKDIEDDLYDSEDKGSHNQILTRLLSLAGGTAEGSNRTETLNYCADLLGFTSPDDLKYKIWEEQFLPSMDGIQRVPITYGSGKHFKLDKLWSGKKEANCLEALMGALYRAGCQMQCQALAALAALCHLVPPDPRVLVPSNWTMAEKVLANAEKMSANPDFFGGDTFLRHLAWKHLDQSLLQ
eukprot:symbB.v1.2.012626.t1/scaffold853.1/size308060/6